MIETPRAAIRADEIAEEADFFSFGTNDLTQMTFGFSRDDVEGRMMSAYLEQGLLKRNPFETIDKAGVGELVRMAVERGRPDQAGAQARRVRRARRRPRVDRPLLRGRARLRVLLAVPGADRPAGRGPGGAVGQPAPASDARPNGRRPEGGGWQCRGQKTPARRGGLRQAAPERPGRCAPGGKYPPNVPSGVYRRGVGIADEDVARVRAATDFVPLASEHMALRRVGRRWVGLCPFHGEKTPSFSVNAEEGLYYCFGCGAKGDVITFVREIEHLDFVEAVEKLAARAGITLHYDDAATSREHQQRARLHDALKQAVDWYHQRLLDRPRRGRGPRLPAVRAGLRRRGGAAVPAGLGARGLGHPGPGPQGPRRRCSGRPGWLRQQGGTAQRLLPGPDPASRSSSRRASRSASAGGSCPAADGPKYKNTAETAVYNKSRVLYGLNWAKKAVVDAGEVVVCEGYTDVIGLHRAGVPQAVATCGTALADGHVRLLTNFARRIVLAYDADGAGQAAAERFYEWERKFEVDIGVAALPAGADPADLARRDPDALRGAVAGAQPFLAFRLDRVLARADLRAPEGRARAAAAAMAVVAEHPNELVRDQYLMQVADAARSTRSGCGPAPGGRWVSPGAGPARAAGPSGRGRSTLGAGPGRRRPRATAGPELEALRLAVHRPGDGRQPAGGGAVRRRAAPGRVPGPGVGHHPARGHRRRRPRRGRLLAAAGGRGGRGGCRRRHDPPDRAVRGSGPGRPPTRGPERAEPGGVRGGRRLAQTGPRRAA